MTEEELLAAIRKTDPEARIEDVGGQRLLRTTSLQSGVALFVNPANMHIIHMDPQELDPETESDQPVAVLTWWGELRWGDVREGKMRDVDD